MFVIVSIIIVDINDNLFIFFDMFYMGDVLENVFLGMMVIRVMVIDNDEVIF